MGQGKCDWANKGGNQWYDFGNTLEVVHWLYGKLTKTTELQDILYCLNVHVILYLKRSDCRKISMYS